MDRVDGVLEEEAVLGARPHGGGGFLCLIMLIKGFVEEMAFGPFLDERREMAQ